MLQNITFFRKVNITTEFITTFATLNMRITANPFY